jgi:Bacterial type II and III secretion system protein
VFTPVVLSEGRISLKVMTEVSDLSTENAMTLQVTGTRRADTTVEIPSGGSLALAGMLARISPAKGRGMVKERYNLAALALRDLRALTPASSRSSDKR